MPTTMFFRYICDLPVQSDGQRPTADRTKKLQFEGCCLPTAQSLPASPRWELGISRWQLKKEITSFQQQPKDRDKLSQSENRPARGQGPRRRVTANASTVELIAHSLVRANCEADLF
jgi:hypothetical protein